MEPFQTLESPTRSGTLRSQNANGTSSDDSVVSVDKKNWVQLGPASASPALKRVRLIVVDPPLVVGLVAPASVS